MCERQRDRETERHRDRDREGKRESKRQQESDSNMRYSIRREREWPEGPFERMGGINIHARYKHSGDL